MVMASEPSAEEQRDGPAQAAGRPAAKRHDPGREGDHAVARSAPRGRPRGRGREQRETARRCPRRRRTTQACAPYQPRRRGVLSSADGRGRLHPLSYRRIRAPLAKAAQTGAEKLRDRRRRLVLGGSLRTNRLGLDNRPLTDCRLSTVDSAVLPPSPGACRRASDLERLGLIQQHAVGHAAQVGVEVAAHHVAQQRAQVALDLVHERARRVGAHRVEVGVLGRRRPSRSAPGPAPARSAAALACARSPRRTARPRAARDWSGRTLRRARPARAAPAGSRTAPRTRTCARSPSRTARAPTPRTRARVTPSIASTNCRSSASSPSTRIHGSPRAAPVGSSSNGCQRPSPVRRQATAERASAPAFHSRRQVSRRRKRSLASCSGAGSSGVTSRVSISRVLGSLSLAPHGLVRGVGPIAAGER